MKKCCKCKKEKNEKEFNFKNKAFEIREKACKECTRAEVRQHYVKNRQYYLEKSIKRNRSQRKIIKEYVYQYLTAHPCIDCGEKDPVVLEFDHISNKSENVSSFIQKNYPVVKIKREIEKCEIRCANCHRRKTAKTFSWYKETMRP